MIKLSSPDEFRVGEGYPQWSIYRFPFKAMDEPGPHSLGRIEWWLEPRKGRKRRNGYKIEHLLVWARQTRDPRYATRVFSVPCHGASLQGGTGEHRDSLLSYAWAAGFCAEHGALCFGAYPAVSHTMLEIDVSLSIMITARFLPREGGGEA